MTYEPMSQEELTDYTTRYADAARINCQPLRANGTSFPHDFLCGKDLSRLKFNVLLKNYLPDLYIEGSKCDGADFAYCTLHRSSLIHSSFRGACFGGATLSGANLTRSDFTGADFTDVSFMRTEMGHAVLTDARGLGVIPRIENLDHKILSAIRSPGNELNMGRWHGTEMGEACDTMHCRAGWAIHLAGRAGYDLERMHGADGAGALLYNAAGSHPTPDWYTSEGRAMQDLEARAGVAS
jgi:uncharacterized protein YjbI with pentapeptide repeats